MQVSLGEILLVLYWNNHLKTRERCLGLCTMFYLFQYEGRDLTLQSFLKSTLHGYVQAVCKNSCLYLSH